jgi:PAS domain S-box-containing protein
MPHSEPVAILLVNEVAEEIKLVTLSFRGFFTSCRVEAVYSLEEAMQWVARSSWHLILIDERLIMQQPSSIFPELKRLAPAATIVVQTDRSDSTSALNTLQAGADFLLYKKSPAFLTELILYTKGALKHQALQASFERVQERHDRLLETLTDVVYELDAEGRFVYLSPTVTNLLGYRPEELTGTLCSKLVPPDQLERAQYRINDRRTGARAARRVFLELLPKLQPGMAPDTRVLAEISAKGLYDAQRRFTGSLGVLHNVTEQARQAQETHALESKLRDADRLLQMAHRVTSLSSDLQTPLTAVLAQSQHLLKTIRDAQLDSHLETLALKAGEAVRRGEELAQAATATGMQQDTLNHLVDALLASAQPSLLHGDRVERAYAAHLPPFTGNRDAVTQLLRILLAYVQRYLTTVGHHHRLRISTAAIGPDGARLEFVPSLAPPVSPAEMVIHLEETDSVATEQGPPIQDNADLFAAYALIKQLGGRLDFIAPAEGLLSLKISIPAEPVAHAQTPVTPAPTAMVSDATAATPSPLPLPQAPTPMPTPTSTPQSQPPAEAATAPTPTRSSAPLPDRRKSQRTSVHLPARITIGNAVRTGTVTNLSPGGAALMIEGLLPSLEQQPAYVILKTAVGILELQATAQDRGLTQSQTGEKLPLSPLAFRFMAPSDIEQKVLASLIVEANERTLSLTVEALLSLPDGTDDLNPPDLETDQRGTNHREAVRVRVALPIRLDRPTPGTATHRALGLVVNFSRSGACFQMGSSPGIVGDVITLHFSSMGPLNQPRTHEPDAIEAVLTARIIWTTPDYRVPSELKPGPSQPGQRIGIRFIQLTPFAEREINRVVAQHIGSSMDLESISSRSPIVSARRECRNARQQVIAMTDDHARHQISPNTPIVLIVPGFGQTQTDYVPLSYYLATNRFRSLRYDHTNHVGQSDGDILQTTLRSMEVDLQHVLEFVRATWPTAPLAILAEDIAARVALKVMARSQSSGSLFLLNPVLDIQAALTTAARRDVITDHQRGLRRGVANLWGLNVNLDQFLGDTVAGEYVGLASTTADLARLAAPPVILTSPRLHRVHAQTFGALDRPLHAVGTLSIAAALQTDVSGESNTQDDRHMAAFRILFNQISDRIAGARASSQPQEPAMRDIHQQQQLEHERIRIRHHVSQAARDALWVAHLAQLSKLANLPDYWGLENELYRRLLPLESGMTVLDIGCGQGDLAHVMLTNQTYRMIHQGNKPSGPIHYIGLGQSHESLKMAEQYVRTFIRELTATFATALAPLHLIETKWLHSDWDAPLPFTEQSIARILYHLSLPFAASPLNCLRQAIQSLQQDGTILLTVFQPQTDLSMLFRRHLQATDQDEFTATNQIILHYLGRMREAIRHGLLHSYERNELARLLVHAGARPTRIIPVLDNQLLLAVVQRDRHAG